MKSFPVPGDRRLDIRGRACEDGADSEGERHRAHVTAVRSLGLHAEKERATPMPIASNGFQATAETQRCDDILVVDDTPANLVAFTAVLDRLGVRVVTANSGEAALRLLSDRDFALLLLDVNMPTMDGFEVARRVRDGDRANGTPIIFITAQAHEDREVLAAYELGAVDFLTKPILPEVLSAKARVFIDLARKAELIREHARREHA